MKSKIISLIEKELSIENLEYFLSLDNFQELYEYANMIRIENFGDVVEIRAILEFSNFCYRKCAYCGLNSNNKNIKRYRMNMDEIIKVVENTYLAGYKTIVLQSGEDKFFDGKKIGEIVRKIKSNFDIQVTVSCGELNFEEYKYIKKCGADKYLLKHETADKVLYQYLHEDSFLKERIKCLKEIKSLGYITGSGFMIGLPRQNLKTIAKDILLLKKLNCDMAGIGPFIPHPETKLAYLPSGSIELTKRAVALSRILMPNIYLPATTSLGVLDSNEKDNIFSCGANVVMRKVTPQKYEELYSIYPNKIKVKNLYEDRKELENELISLGRIPV